MKYFSKYLPVEGEIKAGDKFTNGTLVTEAPVYHAQLQAINDREDWKKVKLFLCSRDIQVGDTIKAIHNNTSGIVTEIKDGKVEPIIHYGAGLFSVQSLLFKVIGEISPDAKWITEGMEFDREDFDIYDVSHLPVNVIHFKSPIDGEWY